MQSISLDVASIEAKINSFSRELLHNHPVLISQVAEIAQRTLKNVTQFVSLSCRQFYERVNGDPVLPIISKINEYCHHVEKVFNIAGSTPLIGYLSGSIRGLFGVAQIIVGIALMTICETSLIYAEQSKNMSDKPISNLKAISKLGLEQTIHGSLNCLRASAETTVSSCTLFMGNIIFLFPNTSHGRNFEPYFAYGTLENGS
jgi:hypothetical protein